MGTNSPNATNGSMADTELPRHGCIASLQTELGLCTIHEATELDDAWIRKLSKQFTNQIGFLPDAARKYRISLGNVKLIKINSMEAGFFMHSLGIRKPARLAQIAISEDAWRKGIGDFSVSTLLKMTRNYRFRGMNGSIRSGLPMNIVAEQTGAKLVSSVYCGAKRGLPIQHYWWEPD